MADKKKLREKLDEVPEEKQKPLSVKDKIAIGVEAIKKEYGIDVEPVKNIKFKIEKVINYINAKYDFRYNVINTDTEYKHKDATRWTYFDDRDYRDLETELGLSNIQIADNKLKSLIYGSTITQDFNPFMDYMNRIPKCDSEYEYDRSGNDVVYKGVKEGTDYIREFCSQVYLVNEEENREYFVEGFRKWFTALVMSLVNDVPHPYYVNQTCLVLVGGQGKYKSTFLKSIVPSDMQLKYFYGSNFQVHNKDHFKLIAYTMLINFDEMAALNKTEIESIKTLISESQVVLRLPYGKADIHLKRRASFAATQNNKEFLKDETGSRRWFVVEVENISMNNDFDVAKMYAQGLQHYKDGMRYHFTNEDIKRQEARNDQFQLKTFEYELVQKYYDVPSVDDIKHNSELIRYMSSTDIAVKLSKDNNINVNNTVKANIGKALMSLGFSKKCRLGTIRSDGKRSRIPLWCVKEALSSETKPLEFNERDGENVI